MATVQQQAEDAEEENAELQAELADEQEELDERSAELDQREADLAAREAAVQQTEEQIAANTIPGSGVFLVHDDIAPGNYRSSNNSGCYWERLSGLSGTFDDIITNDNVDGQAIVEIAGSDAAFATSRCSDWEKIG